MGYGPRVTPYARRETNRAQAVAGAHGGAAAPRPGRLRVAQGARALGLPMARRSTLSRPRDGRSQPTIAGGGQRLLAAACWGGAEARSLTTGTSPHGRG